MTSRNFSQRFHIHVKGWATVDACGDVMYAFGTISVRICPDA
nr:MAG TPA: hypothetical protein [Caudoviricetes sp.]